MPALMVNDILTNIMSICLAPMHETSLTHSGEARVVKAYHSFTCTPCISSESGMSYTCIRLRIYRPRKDGRLNRPWCEVVPVEIRNKSGTPPHSHWRTFTVALEQKWFI